MAYLRYKICFMIFVKDISRCTFLCGAYVAPKISTRHTKVCTPEFLGAFINTSTYTLTEGRAFKTLLKEHYAIVLDSCYTFTKNYEHGNEHDVDRAYGVCIH